MHLHDSGQCRFQRTELSSCISVLVWTVPANGSWRPMPSPNQSRHSREMLSISTGNWVLITVVQAIGKNFTQANGKGTAIYRFSAFETGRAFLPFVYRTFRCPLFPREPFHSRMHQRTTKNLLQTVLIVSCSNSQQKQSKYQVYRQSRRPYYYHATEKHSKDSADSCYFHNQCGPDLQVSHFSISV